MSPLIGCTRRALLPGVTSRSRRLTEATSIAPDRRTTPMLRTRSRRRSRCSNRCPHHLRLDSLSIQSSEPVVRKTSRTTEGPHQSSGTFWRTNSRLLERRCRASCSQAAQCTSRIEGGPAAAVLGELIPLVRSIAVASHKARP